MSDAIEGRHDFDSHYGNRILCTVMVLHDDEESECGLLASNPVHDPFAVAPEERERIGGGLPRWEDRNLGALAHAETLTRLARRKATEEVLGMLADPIGISVDEALAAIERIYR